MRQPELTYIIEDDSVSAFVAEILIKREALSREVKLFVNGEEAFMHFCAALANGTDVPDLILLDLNMPMMDGWDFLDAFASLPMEKDVPVFVLTSSIHPDDRARAQQYRQVKGYFVKPMDDVMIGQMQHLLAQN